MSAGAQTTEATLTIDELAQRTGMTVRNIRAHQSRGLLPAPEVRARTGFYGAEHVARIELIRELQAEGFNLEAIRKLVEQAPGASATELLQFTRAVREPWEAEQPEIVSVDELRERWGEDADPEALRKAVKLGVLRHVEGDRFEQLSPRLGEASAELGRLGIPLRKQLALIERVRRHADGIADTFAKLFVEEVWRPFVEAGRPEDRWPQVRDAYDALRPLAGDAVASVFGLAMTDAVERAFGQELHRLEKRSR